MKKTAQPLKNTDDIKSVRKRLEGNVRDLLIFDFICQTGLPARHWLPLKVRDIGHLKPGDKLPIRGKVKAAGYNPFMTDTLHRTIAELVRRNRPGQDDYLFQSRKHSVPLSISSVSRLVKGWFEKAGFSDLDGLLTLRKTWEAHFRPNPDPTSTAEKESEAHRAVKKYPTRQEIICSELEKEIVMGILKPRQRIIAEKIARKMGVSPIPVREAMSRLEARGFIIKTSQGGSLVRELSKKNLIEICKLRIVLECMAARSAALKHDPSVVEELKRIHRRHAYFFKIDDTDSLLLENKKFHFAIYRSANAPMLLELISLLWDRVSPYHYIFHRQSEIPNPKRGSLHHEKMLAGMKAKDPEEVSRWVKTDLEVSTEFLLKIFEYYQMNQKQSGTEGALDF